MSSTIIHFREDISTCSIDNLLIQLHKACNPKIHIVSNGGGFEFFSTVGPRLSQVGYTAIGEKVNSAAIILFLLGNKRLAHPEGTFFFHEVRAYIDPVTRYMSLCELNEFRDRIEENNNKLKGKTREFFEEWSRELRNAQSWFLRYIQQQSRIDASTILNLMRNEVTLSAKEAVCYGFAQRIAYEEDLIY